MTEKETRKEAIKAFESAIKKGVSFKNKVLFKFPFYQGDRLSDQLIKIIANSIFDLKLKEVKDIHPVLFLNEERVIEIEAICEIGKTIKISFHNGDYSKEQIRLVQLYEFKMFADQEERINERYELLYPVYQVFFTNGIDKRHPDLFDIFQYRNDEGMLLDGNLTNRAYVYLPYINTIIKQKGIDNLSDFEKIVLIIADAMMIETTK